MIHRATLAEYALGLKVSDSATEGSHLKHRRFSSRASQRRLGNTCHQSPLRDVTRSASPTASIPEVEVAINGPHRGVGKGRAILRSIPCRGWACRGSTLRRFPFSIKKATWNQ